MDIVIAKKKRLIMERIVHVGMQVNACQPKKSVRLTSLMIISHVIKNCNKFKWDFKFHVTKKGASCYIFLDGLFLLRL
jgi:hypothetical protein